MSKKLGNVRAQDERVTDTRLIEGEGEVEGQRRCVELSGATASIRGRRCGRDPARGVALGFRVIENPNFGLQR